MKPDNSMSNSALCLSSANEVVYRVFFDEYMIECYSPEDAVETIEERYELPADKRSGILEGLHSKHDTKIFILGDEEVYVIAGVVQ